MRFLHRLSEKIFGFSIALASFWYKHCFGANTAPWRKVGPNFPKFPFSALYCLTLDGVLCVAAQVSKLFVPTRGIHFWAVYSPGFLLISTLLWCKHCTMVKGSSEFPQISVLGPIPPYIRGGTLRRRTEKCTFCNDYANPFLGSP